MLGHYQTILEHVVANPELSLATIPLLTPEEQKQLLLDWNDTATSFPPARCIHHLIEEQVQRTPSAIAVTFADSLLTYHDFNSRANQLAHHLYRLGVRPGMCVGVHLERSLDAMIALLGILKAGCAYVPIDPANPGDRVAFMIQNAQIATLLTHQHLVSALLEHQAQLVCLDSDWPTIATAPTTNPHNDVSVDNLIYVIYTSGSTGKPKGVAMSHRAMCNLLYWQLETMVPPRAARLLQYASLSFDVSFQEIFPTLSTGGTIIMISEELRRDPVALLRFISERQAEKFYLPVVALQQLADASSGLGNVQLSCLREITAAGEQLLITPQMIRFFHQATNCTLHNFYGPTETHGTTIFTLSGEPEQWPTVVPIGCPIANDQNYVLDTSVQLLPIGISGELYLGGVGVADGYFNRPDLTAERFIPDPFSRQPGMRLYKTGDLARWRADGNIEFLGRIDHQVKVRGFRVELEEIEAVLSQHPAVRESVVIVREDVPGDKRLVAYLVTETQQQPTTSELRAIVQAQLPEYMVPGIYMFLDALPLTINRKVDRQKLPKPDRDRPELETNFVAPQTPTEQELAQIWLEVLGIERVGVHDNFFELGGHSLLVTQIISRVRTQFGTEIAVRDLFTASTIAQLAKQIDELLLARLDSNDVDDMLTLLDDLDDAEAERLLGQLDMTT
jgi:amino acid adenylation domain-containing protein